MNSAQLQFEALLADPQVTDLCIHGAHPEIKYWKDGEGWRSLRSPWAGQADRLLEWTLRALGAAGKSWDAREPFVDFLLGADHRAHVVFAPIASCGLTLSLRRLGSRTQPNGSRWPSADRWNRVLESFQSRKNIVICGATGSGKTTLLNDALEQTAGNERVLAIEDTPELFPQLSHFVALSTRSANADGQGEVTQRQLVRQALRMRPDRLIVGECRGAEILDLLTAANTGHRGLACTLHANSCRDALARVELLAHLAYPAGLPSGALRSWIASAFDEIVFVARPEIREIATLAGCEDGTILLRPVVLPRG